ncbi:MAG: excinuclease ABC subunit UvrA [bacterium]
MGDWIEIRGARQNNLKNVSVKIEQERLTAFTGVSGSGKSSLVFDTLFAEGQRRFVESQSTYARQFLQRLDKPDVDAIEGLRPTIAVQSKNTYKSSRSTVGTVTEIYDYLRLIFAKAGELHCPECGDAIRPAATDAMIADIIKEFDGSKAYALAPMEVSAKMTPPLLRETVRSHGYSYIVAGGGEPIDLETVADEQLGEALAEALKQAGKTGNVSNGLLSGAQVFIVVDRLTVGAAKKRRIADSVETALREGGGVFAVRSTEGKQKFFTARAQCLKCGIAVFRPSPQHLSFNSAVGACPRCKGFGDTYEIDMDAVVPDRNKSLREGAIECWETRGIRRYARKMFMKSDDELGVRPTVPFKDLTTEEVNLLLTGYGELYGLNPFFEKMKQKSYKPSNRFFLQRYRKLQSCADCGGSRLNREALSVRLGGKNIAELGAMPIGELNAFFEALELPKGDRETVKVPLREVISRTRYIKEIGLGYLTIDRLSRTLSGGEMQRIHLAGHLGARLTGTLYVLDEPTVGLHPRDTERLIRVLKDLRDIGNTVVVVEHDLQVIRACDRVTDIGPGPGERGGNVVFDGEIKDFVKSGATLTADYLTGRKKVSDFTRLRPKGGGDEFFTVRGAKQNNLKNIDVRFPAGRFTCVTGVSGSGKSSLVCDVLYPYIARKLGAGDEQPGACDAVDGWQIFGFAEMMGQDPIGQTSRANSLTFLGAFSPIRDLFAATEDARKRGLAPGAFSFNVAGGRCEKCMGAGSLEIDMQFLADVTVVCDECNGSRYQKNVLDVKYNEKNISDVFAMTAAEALVFFRNSRPLVRKMQALDDVGLGYIRIGQPLNTLSGGESQRLKIARELTAGRKGRGLYIFDEPTMGLHCDEVGRFLRCADRLISEGHTVVVIEHNLDVIAQADHVIDLGPEGGNAGGRIIAQGTPKDVASNSKSITGKFLKEHIKINS